MISISKLFKTAAITSGVAAMLALSPATQAAEKVIEIKAAHGDVETHPLHYTWLHFKEVLEKESKGHFKVNVYPNGQMGGDRELTEAVQMGNIDTTAVSTSPVAAFNKNYFALDMPFMFKDRPEAYAVLDGKLGKLLLDSLDKNNLKGLSFFENGFRVLTNGVREVRTPSDLGGMKLRTMQNSVHLAMWKAEGANPTPMSYNEVFTALQQRTIDGQENPTPQIWNAKFFEVQKFLTVTNHSYTPYVLFMNKDFYNKLSDDDKKLIASASRQMTEFNRKLATEQADECMENIRKAGLKITTLTDEELGKFREKALTVLPMIEKDLDKDVLAAFQEVVKKK